MPTQPPLPPLLAPYVSSLSPSSLTLVSSVLGATGNWLVLRFLYAALNASSSPNSDLKKRKVVLVSFLRGWEFWRTEAKRLGLDLARLTDKGQFAFVDGLSELFHKPTSTTAVSSTSTTSSSPWPGTTSSRAAPLPIRTQPNPGPARTPQPDPATSNVNQNRAPTETGPLKRLHFSGNGVTALDALERDIISVINQLKSTASGRDQDGDEETELLLIIDQPDLLLAATGPGRGIGATEMGEWVMGLQRHAYSTLLTLSADSPLIHNASAFGHQQTTPLETENAAFVVGSAHRARTVMQLRNLETGAASDVSGVLRVSKGGAWEESDKISDQGNWEEKEVLYFVQRDGGLKIFGRGE